ncbi:hypothetical protein ACFE04_003094 [Oxalis oulophora]
MKDPLEQLEDRKMSKRGQLKLSGHCREPGHNRSTCPLLGKGKGKKSVTKKIRNRVGPYGMGLYIDPISGRRTLNPGTPLERAVDMNAGSYRAPPIAPRRPVASQPTGTSQPTPASQPTFTSQLQSFTTTSSLAPPPLPISHAGFNRSGVLCIPGNGGVTASQIRGKIIKTTKG